MLLVSSSKKRRNGKLSGCQRHRFGLSVEGWLNAGTRNRQAKIREAVARPGESFGMDLPVIPAELRAGLRMINNPVLCLAQGLNERAMSNTPDVVSLFEHRAVFRPDLRVQHVGRFGMKQSEAIIRGPTPAG